MFLHVCVCPQGGACSEGCQGCARFPDFVKNFSERQILWSLCSVDFHTLTLQLPIQTPHSVAPELQVFVSSLKISAKRAHPWSQGGCLVPGVPGPTGSHRGSAWSRGGDLLGGVPGPRGAWSHGVPWGQCLVPRGDLLGGVPGRGEGLLQGGLLGGCLVLGGLLLGMGIPACTEADPPPAAEMATAADGMHPTGMHSFSNFFVYAKKIASMGVSLESFLN